eukprot:gb/GECG01008252.1/.p1 GENE.gb/GECG01008252.1/~~gb/GECG01008252.1/.p1  ORF type:complete len:447 (+),score=40.90 gb/GECG01008252.1/:1-1341(+)
MDAHSSASGAATGAGKQLVKALLSLIKGLRNGLLYGTKIRLPHALVMTVLFKQGQLSKKLQSILQVTFEHASKLGLYVVIYKLCLKALALLQNMDGRQTEHISPWNPAIAGAIGASIVWRRYSSVNMQILMYLLGRTLVGAVRALAKEGVWPLTQFQFKEHGFPLVSVLTWAAVMYLHQNHKEALQGSLSSSMDFLYHESDQWHSWRDFVPSPSSAFVTSVTLLKDVLGVDLVDKLSEPIDAILSPSYSSPKLLLYSILPVLFGALGIPSHRARDMLDLSQSGSAPEPTSSQCATSASESTMALDQAERGRANGAKSVTFASPQDHVVTETGTSAFRPTPTTASSRKTTTPNNSYSSDFSFYTPSPQTEGPLLKTLERETAVSGTSTGGTSGAGKDSTSSNHENSPAHLSRLPSSPVSSSDSGRSSTEPYTSGNSPAPAKREGTSQ